MLAGWTQIAVLCFLILILAQGLRMSSETSNERMAEGAHDEACFFSLLLKQNWTLSLSTSPPPVPNHELHAGARSSLMQVARVTTCPP